MRKINTKFSQTVQFELSWWFSAFSVVSVFFFFSVVCLTV